MNKWVRGELWLHAPALPVGGNTHTHTSTRSVLCVLYEHVIKCARDTFGERKEKEALFFIVADRDRKRLLRNAPPLNALAAWQAKHFYSSLLYHYWYTTSVNAIVKLETGGL